MPESAKKLESEWNDIMGEIRVTDALYDLAKNAFDDFWSKKKSALWSAANKKREAYLAALEAEK